jgi:hypothetical protein
MVTSVHLADVRPSTGLRLLRTRLTPDEIPGLRYAKSVIAAPLGPRLLPSPRPGRVGLIAAWEDDGALDRFLASHPVAEALAGGYRVRLEPVRVVGAWPELGDLLPAAAADGVPNRPAAVLTLGRLRLRRGLAFLRASARAERDALRSPGLLLAAGLAHPPRIVATFSLWSDVTPMRAYVEQHGGGHRQATTEHAARPFHSQSAFIRFRPYDETGNWHPQAPDRAAHKRMLTLWPRIRRPDLTRKLRGSSEVPGTRMT